MAMSTIFDQIIQSLQLVVRSFPDKRTGKNLTYTIEDIVLSAFSVFFYSKSIVSGLSKNDEENEGEE